MLPFDAKKRRRADALATKRRGSAPQYLIRPRRSSYLRAPPIDAPARRGERIAAREERKNRRVCT